MRTELTGQERDFVILFQFGQYGINVKGHDGRCTLDKYSIEGTSAIGRAEP